MDSPNYWHFISQLGIVLYRNHMVLGRQGSAALEIPNHWISPSVTSVKAFKMKNRNNISLDSSNPNQKRRYGRNSQAYHPKVTLSRFFELNYFKLAITSLRMIEMDIWENKNVEHNFQVIFSVQSTRVLLFFIFRFQPSGSHRIFGSHSFGSEYLSVISVACKCVDQ